MIFSVLALLFASSADAKPVKPNVYKKPVNNNAVSKIKRYYYYDAETDKHVMETIDKAMCILEDWTDVNIAECYYNL